MGWRDVSAALLVMGCTSSPGGHGDVTGGGAGRVPGGGAVATGGGNGAAGVGGSLGGSAGGGVVAGNGGQSGARAGAEGVGAAGANPGGSGAGTVGAAGAAGSMAAECGNGTVEAGEKCEGSEPGQTCEGLGFGAGTLACRDCLYDTSGCGEIGWTAFCGDGVAGTHACDGGEGQCNELQFSVGLSDLSGTASCTDDCVWAFDECEGWPGEDYCEVAGYYDNGYCDECQLYGGVIDPDCVDACGPPLSDGGAGGVGGAGGAGAGLVSDGFCTDRLVGHETNCEIAGFQRDPDCGQCGDGVLTFNGYVATEFCENTPDGPIFIGGANACSHWGYAGGKLRCAANCTPNFANCH